MAQLFHLSGHQIGLKLTKIFFVKIFSEECHKAPARPKQRGLVILAVSLVSQSDFERKDENLL